MAQQFLQPTSSVFNVKATNLNDFNMPYRELRATDQGYFRPREALGIYSGETPGRNPVPWWTSLGTVDRNGMRDDAMITTTNNDLKARVNHIYNSDGVVTGSGFPSDDRTTTLVKRSVEPLLWRKVCEPKRAFLTEVKGQLVWREVTDNYDSLRPAWTTTSTGPVYPGHIQSSPVVVSQTPYRVY